MPKILIIEDNALMREMIIQILRRDNHSVLEACDGSEGVSLARTERPDLIILDMMMPQMSGEEVAQYLKSDDAMAKIPIIVVSAVNQVDTVLKMLTMKNVRDYLLKPVNPTTLRERIQATIETIIQCTSDNTEQDQVAQVSIHPDMVTNQTGDE